MIFGVYNFTCLFVARMSVAGTDRFTIPEFVSWVEVSPTNGGRTTNLLI